MIGQTVSPHKILEHRGGMGVAHKAEKTRVKMCWKKPPLPSPVGSRWRGAFVLAILVDPYYTNRRTLC
jgi:hypothetical protein